MVAFLDYSDPKFDQAFQAIFAVTHKQQHDHVIPIVTEIIAEIQAQGDDALLSYTNKLDRRDITHIEEVRVTGDAIAHAVSACDPSLIEALYIAKERIYDYHKRQLPSDFMVTDDCGVMLGNRWHALDSVGLYVPGGTASYPSSVLMNAVPAKVADVERIVMVVPAPEGQLNPLVLAAAHVAEIDEVYTVGGAQAIAALAYGTHTVPAVDKIVGPGNAYVAEAKRQVFGAVGIDMIAGPSDITVVAEAPNNPQWIAMDLLSQAEHDVMARAVLITDDALLAKEVTEQVEQLLETLPRKEIAAESWHKNSAVIIVPSIDKEGVDMVNRIAPEHIELMVAQPERLLPEIRHAGAVFLGQYTPEAIGDYIAGPSHVLPTSGTARFSSGLSVFDFLKRSSVIDCSQSAFEQLRKPAEALAYAESLDAHALSMSIRKHQPS